MEHLNGRDGEKKRQKIRSLFKEYGFDIEISSVRKFIDFLDVRMDITSKSYEIYLKPNTKTQYVNKKSNHPPTILKNKTEHAEKRLKSRCSDRASFEKHAPHFNKILHESGYKKQLKYPENENKNKNKPKKRRKRNILWFNPPYCKSVLTNIGQIFFKLLEKHFPKDSPYRKFYNRNSIKLSYCTMNNVKSIIHGHNKKKRELELKKRENNENESKNSELCNCRVPKDCPVNNECLLTSLIYEALLIIENGPNKGKEYSYLGLAGNTFKERFGGHKSTLNHRERAQTTLSSFHHELNDAGVKHRIEWRILESGLSKWNGKSCKLCEAEKRYILNNQAENQLNKRTELRSMCMHIKKFGKKRGRPKKAKEEVIEGENTEDQEVEENWTQQNLRPVAV